MKKLTAILLLCIAFAACLHSQTIAEKKAGLGQISSDLSPEMQQMLRQMNSEYEVLEKELQELYTQAQNLYQQHAPENAYQELLAKIKDTKKQMTSLQEQWKEATAQNQKDEYALWQQPSTTLDQLVMDYGSQDYIYLVPTDIANMTVSINSNLPIPRSSWNEILEIILAQNGVGVRQLNPYLRQLYLIQSDHSGLKLITNKRRDLIAFPSNERVAFVLSPEPSDVRRAWFFLEKFVNPNTTFLQMIGRDILIVSTVAEVQEILKLYDFISANRGDKEYKVVTLNRIDADEMAKILGAIFGVLEDEPSGMAEIPRCPPPKGPNAPAPTPPRPTCTQISGGDNGLTIIPLAQVARAVFLVGTREEICKAERIIREVEDEVGESRGKVIYWYTTKHSEAEELAEVLSRIYYLMVSSGPMGDDELSGDSQYGPVVNEDASVNVVQPPPPPPLPPIPHRRPYEQGFFLDESYVVNNTPPPLPPPVNVGRDNFLVDPKTGAIVMVVEADILPKMKELIRKLDVPKKMVLIEVLLFEKKLNRENDFGMNLLKVGSKASQTHQTAATFNVGANGLDPSTPLGIFEFLISRAKSSIPAYDIKYKFLLAQDDIHINSCPSVLAINQTSATIEITEEISVNTGIYAVDTVGGVTLQNAFARARYGIKIDILPTIHMAGDNDEFMDDTPDYVTLDTDIQFQTIAPGDNPQQPDVTTRHVINDVSVPDGQTVIIGGLRQRHSNDASEKIPFLGEIPGLGKLFSLTEMEDDTTEMIIFITPKIIVDPVVELERIKLTEMCRRPGDVPGFLCRLDAAQEWEKNRLFHDSLTMLFGRRPDRCVWSLGEYDGR